ncbi:potassium-transporting ATPase subunit KdpC [Streptomyces gibsoniae]|uniref:Potassium-transporting ATPase KdpC subunit n=1 Tax=Streptomyces gibsoniae TaxID=3075529 RepID=A0ABU2U478_9ACTN|nr:potassium-transporting ATPase subunit KdpC [Streptomyces sp. DSM 41699]MDT0467817.1 potassium-transporting ATPase subunit KdpC [Streptomyces sp. DSM 41699]
MSSLHRYFPAPVRNHLSALRMLLVFTVVTGVIYPLAVWGVGQVLFSDQANGSQIRTNGKVVGSSLIGQSFDLPKKNPNDASEAARPDPKWFQPRYSAADYDPLASGASNLGPTNQDLVRSIRERRAAIAEFNGVDPAAVPADAVTASGSGLDPDISPAYAKLQIARVAKARGLSEAQVHKLVDEHTQDRILGFLGEKRVNVVTLNQALSKLG